MSFILDALKKSETDRQRQNGPALFEVRVAPPKTGLPLWAIGLGVLLAVNLIIVAWVLLRKSSTPDTAATPPAGVAQTQSVNAGRASGPPYPGAQGYGAPQGYPAPAGYPRAPGEGGGQAGYAGASEPGYAGGQQGYAPGQGAGYPTPQGYPPGQGQQGYPNGQGQGYPGGPGQQAYAGGQGPAGSGQQYAAAGYSGQRPYGAGNGAENGYPQGQPGVNGSNLVPGAGRPPGAVPGAANGVQAEAGGERLSPDDYAPAADAGPAPPFKEGVTRATSAGVPLYRDAAALPGVNIPQLRLDLHVFAAKPQERFIMVNMHKLHEGDTTPDGVRVEEIRPDGAVLSKDGVKFLLPRD